MRDDGITRHQLHFGNKKNQKKDDFLLSCRRKKTKIAFERDLVSQPWRYTVLRRYTTEKIASEETRQVVTQNEAKRMKGKTMTETAVGFLRDFHGCFKQQEMEEEDEEIKYLPVNDTELSWLSVSLEVTIMYHSNGVA